MAYSYPVQSDVTKCNIWCTEIINIVQKKLKNYFTFDIRLIGSGEKRLVTQNGDGCFDLDYNLIIKKDKCGLLNEPNEIKKLFTRAFSDILKKKVRGITHSCDSSSVVTNEIIIDDKLVFKFDVAIIVEGDDDCYYKLVNNKYNASCIWNKVPESQGYMDRYNIIKEEGLFSDFKEEYLRLKNIHLSKQDGVKSFSIFLETLNNIEQRYGTR